MDPKRTHLHTDGGAGYRTIAQQFAAHEFGRPLIGEYTRGNVSTNLTEGYFSQFKRSMDGTHHHVSVEHLQRYLYQFDFCTPTASAPTPSGCGACSATSKGDASPTSQ